ncbi:SRPBCC domain-containing protein [Amycolatopsis sp. BJA-103]|uniref:SRPBCC family protein n=1 Tax=Amycolatopsis sp. BJA-103 TaxID=1911175 RepID=UPI000C777055|nr:SRPBCC family protein [Amycolatopsis sp. BJA-103]AUI61438.1 ATPase [Amycolatopsis sp. BJA-103]PNE21268.1 ATPase [Amycolatopsis sp. BJA-103]
MTEPASFQVRVRAPIDDVWHALIDPGALRTWFSEHAEVDLPSRYEFWGRYTPDGEVPRQRLLLAEDNVLRFAWTVDGTETIVELELAEDGDGTSLSYSQTGLPDFAELMADSDSPLGMMHTFWALAVANLVDHVEGRPITARCDLTSPVMREEVRIGAARPEVYHSITDPAAFTRWFGARIEAEMHVGGRWAMGSLELDPDPAKIVDLVPDERMTLAYEEGIVTSWELEDSGGGTRLTFVQSGFSGEKPPYGSWMGWLSGLAELRRFHEVDMWLPIWVDVHLDGMPEGLIALDGK